MKAQTLSAVWKQDRGIFKQKIFLMLNGSNAIYDMCFWTIQAFQVADFFFKSDSIIDILLEISSFQKQEFSNIYISNYTFESCINLE